MKVCFTCQQEKPLTDYSIVSGYVRKQCKPCDNARKRAWDKKNATYRAAQKAEQRRAMKTRAFPLPAVYVRGERCWCCRRETVTAMLCKRCLGKR